MKKNAIIVAGGSGSRMNSTTPKQFLLIDNVPILVHTIRKFFDYDSSINLVVVLPESHISDWERIRLAYFKHVEIHVVRGGSSRSASVQSGLQLVNEGLVAVHDAVRPFVSLDTISDSFKSADKYGSGVATVQLKDSIRELDGNTSLARERSHYVLVQTPQTFQVNSLKDSYALIGEQSFTDDASVFEAAGNSIHLVNGTFDNIKITTPEDMK